MSLDDLYQEILLDHARHPRRRGEIGEGEALADLENPVCGDHVRVRLRIEEGRVKDLLFDGKGCAISTASSSLLAEYAEGRTVAELRESIARFTAALRGEGSLDEFVDSDLRALEGVKEFPMRIKCATLAWHALAQALDHAENKPAGTETNS